MYASWKLNILKKAIIIRYKANDGSIEDIIILIYIKLTDEVHQEILEAVTKQLIK